MWHFLKTTQKLKNEIEREKQQKIIEVSLECGVMYQQDPMKEYYRYMGYIQSLDKVLKMIEEIKDVEQ